jgi:hypothetical protein
MIREFLILSYVFGRFQLNLMFMRMRISPGNYKKPTKCACANNGAQNDILMENAHEHILDSGKMRTRITPVGYGR